MPPRSPPSPTPSPPPSSPPPGPADRDLGAPEAKVRKAPEGSSRSAGRRSGPARRVAQPGLRSLDRRRRPDRGLERSPTGRAAGRPPPSAEQAAQIANFVGTWARPTPRSARGRQAGLTPSPTALEALRDGDRPAPTRGWRLRQGADRGHPQALGGDHPPRGRHQVTVTSRVETVVIDWGGGRSSGAHSRGAPPRRSRQSAEKFRRTPEVWRNYVEPAMDESKPVAAADRGHLPVDARRADQEARRGPGPRRRPSRNWRRTHSLRARIEEAYAAKAGGAGKQPPQPRPDPSKARSWSRLD